MINLREREISALGKILALKNSGIDMAEDFSDQWKVLIYDHDCRDIISPLLNVGDLRGKGVTLHMLINSDREAVPDAPAIYFIRPTEENMKRLVTDCSKQLYKSIYLHFVTRIERPVLEKFAQELVSANSSSVISKLCDQYLDIIALEPSMFSLNIKNSFLSFNDPSLGETQIKTFISRVSMGLLSMVRVLGYLPIIRAPTGGAAEMLAHELSNALRENIAPRGPAHALFTENLSSDRPRPLLLIFDRTADMAPPLLHTSTYQSLIDDLLEHHLNRVTIEISSKDGPAKKKTYDLNTQSDQFFARYAGSPFPEAVEANEKELAEVSQKENEIRSNPRSELTAAESVAGIQQSGGKDLSEAIESLPELLARKANLEAHTNILQAVMKKVAARDIPTYFEVEQAILTTGRVEKSTVITLLKDSVKGTIEDKARLLLIVTIYGSEGGKVPGQEEYESAFSQGCTAMLEPELAKTAGEKVLKAVAFVRRLQSLQTPFSQRFGAGNTSAGALSSLLTSAQSMAASTMAKAASFFTKFASLYVTKVVENLSEGRSCSEDDSFCTLDPRSKQGEIIDLKGSKYSEVIVFIMGGGCYSEFFNLQDLLKHKASSGSSLRNIIYGSTEILAGDDFCRQLQLLGVNK